jgi:MoaA/NifB/PqqE/SkfB family radical SAM enzyme
MSGRLVRSTLRGLLRRGPVYAMVQVTSRCNQRCRMCQVWTMEHSATPDLPTARYRSMAGVLARAGVGLVGIAGEPFLREDLPGIVSAFSQAGLATRVQTNGSLIQPDMLDAVLDAGLGGVSISVHSLDAEQMDWITGTPGALEAALRGAALVAEATARQPGFLRVINLVLFPGNLDQVPAVLGWCREHGFRLSLIPIHTAPQRSDERQFVRDLPPGFVAQPGDHERVDALVRDLRRARREGLLLNSSRFLSMVPDFLAGRPVRWPCRAGELYLFVDHRGQVAACHDLPPLGDIFDEGVQRELMAGRLAQRAAPDRQACPGCLLPCWAELSLVFDSPRSFLEALELNLTTPLLARALRRGRGAP